MLNQPFQKIPGKDKGKYSGLSLSFVPFCVTFFMLIIAWLFFSGRFDTFHLIMGVISCLLISAISCSLLFPKGIAPHMFRCGFKFTLYLPWLFYQIFLANLHLLYLTFHPRMIHLINPKIIEFNTCLKTDASRTTFANSITLTPGTITVYAGVMGRFVVHCIDDTSGQGLPGEMEDRIKKVFETNE